ncbi:MAG TPA: hypothetical protein PLP21_18070 [Pyrinomonadaceae bacterium]|nr:hypothetical protein [Acidobacteriota bacterium]HQZ98231.1 hypothetical protein [Pyrinomonadaceae bacterium]
MRTRFFALSAIAVLLVNVVSFAAVDARTARLKKAEVTRLVNLLPASDGVVVFDSKRFVNDALPKILSANQPMLTEVMAKITEMETTTGIDLRKFDQVTVGVAIKTVSAKEYDYEPVALANGDINAGALIAVAKLASKGTYREENIGDKTVFVFTPKDVLQKAQKPANSKVADLMDQALKGLTKEVAVTALDKNTIAIGSVPRIRETIAGGTRLGADVTSLLSVKETSVMSFAVKAPGGLSKMVPLDNDELGANLDSIDYLSGSLDVAVAGTSLFVSARTKKAAQAQSLKDSLDGLKMVGGAIFGGSKRPDQQIYGRLIKNAKVESRGNDVSIELLVPQADIDGMIGGIK